MAGRYELKFLVDAAQRERLLGLIGGNLVADPHGVEARYRISSMYYDTENLRYYTEKVDGIEVRKKVRLRFYHPGDDAEPRDLPTACFMEIKRRFNNAIVKERVTLDTAGALRLLRDEGLLARLHDFAVPANMEERESLVNLDTIIQQEDLHAVNIITYIREAWMGVLDERLRLTFDCFMQAYSPWQVDAVRTNGGAPLATHNAMVLELKFDRAIPVWLRDAIVSLGLVQQRFSKYARGVECLRENPGPGRRLML